MTVTIDLQAAILAGYQLASLDALVGPYYQIQIERQGNNRSAYETQCCVVMDGVTTSVNVGKNKRGHDKITKQFFVIGTDPIEIARACHKIFDAFNREPGQIALDPSAGNLVGCVPTTAREPRIGPCRLPIPSAKSLLQGQVDIQLWLTRGEAP